MGFAAFRARCCTPPPYDDVSKKKQTIDYIGWVIYIILFLAALISFAITDALHPTITSTPTFEIPFKVPYISLAFGHGISNCTILNANGAVFGSCWKDISNVSSIDGSIPFETLDLDTPLPNGQYRIKLNLFDIPECRVNGTSNDPGGYELENPVQIAANPETVQSPRIVFHDNPISTFEELELYWLSTSIIGCNQDSCYRTTKQVYTYKNGTVSVTYISLLEFTSPVFPTDSGGELYLIFDNLVYNIQEETRWQLFQRIVTQAGGLLSIIAFIVAGYVLLHNRIALTDPVDWYNDNTREAILYTTRKQQENRGMQNMAGAPQP